MQTFQKHSLYSIPVTIVQFITTEYNTSESYGILEISLIATGLNSFPYTITLKQRDLSSGEQNAEDLLSMSFMFARVTCVSVYVVYFQC